MLSRQYEILALTLRYWLVFLMAFIFFQAFKDTWRSFRNRGQYIPVGNGNIPFVLSMFVMSAFTVLSMRQGQGIDEVVILLGVLIVSIVLFQYYLLKFIFDGLDGYIILIMDALAVLGFIMLHRLNPAMGFRQVEWFGIGNLALIMAMVFTIYINDGRKIYYPFMAMAFALLFYTLLKGTTHGGAKSWVEIGKKHAFQPSEFIKIILVFVMAIDLKDKKRWRDRLPMFIFAAMVTILVAAQRDLGTALLYFCIFIFMYYTATADWFTILGALGASSGGAVLSYKFFSHVRVRVQTWKNPWAAIEDKGYQIAQALIAIGSGGLNGTGLGLGIPQIIPASKTDFIFAAICEEMGILIGLMMIGFYAIIIMRGITIALNAYTPFDAILCVGATASIAIQSFIIIGGVIKLIPLTGVTMPFVSYGGSSMLASLGLVGIIEGVAIKTYRRRQSEVNEQHEEEENWEMDTGQQDGSHQWE